MDAELKYWMHTLEELSEKEKNSLLIMIHGWFKQGGDLESLHVLVDHAKE